MKRLLFIIIHIFNQPDLFAQLKNVTNLGQQSGCACEQTKLKQKQNQVTLHSN